MIGLQRSTVSPCSSSISRSTPWVLGCAGPMLMIIVWSSSGVRGDVAELGRLGLAHPQHGADLAQQLAGRQLAARLEPLRTSEPLRIVSTMPVAGTSSSAGVAGRCQSSASRDGRA